MTDLAERYVEDTECPAGWKDLGPQLTSGVFDDKDILPSEGAEIEVRWKPSWKSTLRRVERYRVTGTRRKLKDGWTVVLERTFGTFDWDVGVEMRLDKLAQAIYEAPGTLVFGRNR